MNSLPSYCPSFEGMQQPTSMKVNLLLVDGERAWNEQVLRELFQPEIVSHILKIPLGKTAESDKLIWCDSQLGQFSVKSAYFKARTMLGRDCH